MPNLHQTVLFSTQHAGWRNSSGAKDDSLDLTKAPRPNPTAAALGNSMRPTMLRLEPSKKSTKMAASIPVLGTVLLAALMSGCGDGSAPINEQSNSISEAAPNSVGRLGAPKSRSDALEAKLNRLREQTFAANLSNLTTVHHRDELYTAALRHAINLNTANSINATSRGPGIPADVLVPDMNPRGLLIDYTWTTTTTTEGGGTGGGTSTTIGAEDRYYPAFFTSADRSFPENSPWQRVLAVRGGPSLLRSRSESLVSEFYTFRGNIWTTDGEQVSFRGFNEDNVQNLEDAVDNIWYTTKGRVALMRDSLKYFGYARKDDTIYGQKVRPPYPIFNDRFTGVFTALHSQPLVSRFGHWPNNGNVDVSPYGLDTAIGGPAGYAGPPISITLPLAEPMLIGSGTFKLTMEKLTPGRIVGQKQVKIFTNQSGLTVDLPSASAPNADQLFTGSSGTATLVDQGRVISLDQDALVPNGYSVITFASDVSLADVRPGDSIQLIMPDDPDTDFVNEDGLLTGIYTVLANKDRADYGTILSPQYAGVVLPYPITNINIDQLPNHSLAVSYVGGATPIFGTNEFYPSQDPNVSFSVFASRAYPYDWFEEPNEGVASASILSASLVRAAVEVDPTLGLRDGEIVFLPTEPLEPLTRYRVTVFARTISQPFNINFEFTTNGSIAPLQ